MPRWPACRTTPIARRSRTWSISASNAPTRQRRTGVVGQHHHLLVVRFQLAKERDQVRLGRDAIMFAAQDQDRAFDLLGIDDRQVGAHVEIGARRHGRAVLQLGIRERIRHPVLDQPDPVPVEDRMEKGAVHIPGGVGSEMIEILAPLLQRRRALTGPYERIERQRAHVPGMQGREEAGPERAGRAAEEMKRRLAGFGDHKRHRRGEVRRTARDIGVAVRAIRAAVILVVHRPDVEAVVGEPVHHREAGLPRHLEVEAGARAQGRAMHEKQDGRALGHVLRMLAEDIEADIAFLHPVLVLENGLGRVLGHVSVSPAGDWLRPILP
ncbi:MAG: hypothetical protein VW453_11110 [Rhodospirillaceae bacterium]